MMRRSFVLRILLAVTVFVGMRGTTEALPITLSAGESAVLNFDFVAAGVVPPPPYSFVTAFVSLTDVDAGDAGLLELFEGLDATGAVLLTNGSIALNVGIATNFPSAVDGIFSLRYTITSGSATVLGGTATAALSGQLTPTVTGVLSQQAVPEPATLALLGLGVMGIALRRKRALPRDASQV